MKRKRFGLKSYLCCGYTNNNTKKLFLYFPEKFKTVSNIVEQISSARIS